VKAVTDNELRALVSLLDDENHRIARLVRQKFLEIGADAKPYLERATQSEQAVVGKRARSILQEIRLDEAEAEIAAFVRGPITDSDLEDGAFLVARIGYPDLDRAVYARLLDEMAGELRTRLEGRNTGLGLLRAFSDFLFGELGFSGNNLNYYDPDNSYMNRVLDRRSGIPITLSLVYLFLARRVGLAMEGIGLPGHFVVRFPGADGDLYVDAFDGGRVLSRGECARFLISAGQEPRAEYFIAATPREVLARMLRNLIHIYREGNDKGRVDRLGRLSAALAAPTQPEPR
jgi:regulator of sirC expression with transglutaminase-like and TPR domain